MAYGRGTPIRWPMRDARLCTPMRDAEQETDSEYDTQPEYDIQPQHDTQEEHDAQPQHDTQPEHDAQKGPISGSKSHHHKRSYSTVHL
jgi:hypothetical protein